MRLSPWQRRVGRLLPRGEQRVGVEALDLEPVEVERLERPRELDDPAHPVVELDVDRDADPGPDDVAQRADPGDRVVERLVVDRPVEIARAASPGRRARPRR